MRNSYQLCNNGTLRVMYANGMSISFHSEPHVLAGTVTPTIGRCNISLPMENGLNSIEWRLRKEQIKGKVTVFGRKLRVSRICHYNNDLLFCGQKIYFPFWRMWLSYFSVLKMYSSGIILGLTIFPLFERSVHCMGSSAAVSYRSFITKSIPKEAGKKIRRTFLQVTALLKVMGRGIICPLTICKNAMAHLPRLVPRSTHNYSLNGYVLLL